MMETPHFGPEGEVFGWESLFLLNLLLRAHQAFNFETWSRGLQRTPPLASLMRFQIKICEDVCFAKCWKVSFSVQQLQEFCVKIKTKTDYLVAFGSKKQTSFKLATKIMKPISLQCSFKNWRWNFFWTEKQQFAKKNLLSLNF